MLWTLRYRGIKGSNGGSVRGVHEVWIETDSDDESEARQVSDFYLSTLNGPSTIFLSVRRAVAMTTRREKSALTSSFDILWAPQKRSENGRRSISCVQADGGCDASWRYMQVGDI